MNEQQLILRKLYFPATVAVFTACFNGMITLALTAVGSASLILISAALTVAIFYMAIGLYQGKEWARKAGSACFYILLLGLVRLGFFFIFGFKMLQKSFAATILQLVAESGQLQIPPNLLITAATIQVSVILLFLYAFSRCNTAQVRQMSLQKQAGPFKNLNDEAVFVFFYGGGQLITAIFSQFFSQSIFKESFLLGGIKAPLADSILGIMVIICQAVALYYIYYGRKSGLWLQVFTMMLSFFHIKMLLDNYSAINPMLITLKYRLMETATITVLLLPFFYKIHLKGLACDSTQSE